MAGHFFGDPFPTAQSDFLACQPHRLSACWKGRRDKDDLQRPLDIAAGQEESRAPFTGLPASWNRSSANGCGSFGMEPAHPSGRVLVQDNYGEVILAFLEILMQPLAKSKSFRPAIGSLHQ